MNRFWVGLFAVALSTGMVRAQWDEAAAVERHCGQPQAEHEGMSQVTNRLQRDLRYGDATLHFVPDGQGWTFTTAWRGHLPVMRSNLEESMPCFGDAVKEVAVRPVALEDPTIAQQVTPAVRLVNADIARMVVIVLLVIMVLGLAFWPRKVAILAAHPAPMRTRKPRSRARLPRIGPRPTNL